MYLNQPIRPNTGETEAEGSRAQSLLVLQRELKTTTGNLVVSCLERQSKEGPAV